MIFKCISYALLPHDKKHDNDNNFKIIRNKLADHINEDLFENIIDIYKILKNNGEFKELWDPYNITIEDFKYKIKSGGDDYWGDFILLSILIDILQINIIVLYTNTITGDYYNYPLFYEYNMNNKTIILSYEDEEHFKLIGYYNDSKMIYIFNHENIPTEILRLTNIMR